MKKRILLVFSVLLLLCLAFLWNNLGREEKIKLILIKKYQDHFSAVSCEGAYERYEIYVDMNKIKRIKEGAYVNVYYDQKKIGKDEKIEIVANSVKKSNYKPPLEEEKMYKPVIYLYPEEREKVSVSLELKGKLTQTMPTYQNGWDVTADSDGTLTDATGTKYPYLFWEADCKLDYDMSRGFCVPGEDTEEFLSEKLCYMGLNEREVADFMEFWLPYMKSNPYNKICFQTSVYTENVKLNVSPKPDSMLRVYMVYQPLERYVELEKQVLEPFERDGFSVIEWGGAIVK